MSVSGLNVGGEMVKKNKKLSFVFQDSFNTVTFSFFVGFLFLMGLLNP